MLSPQGAEDPVAAPATDRGVEVHERGQASLEHPTLKVALADFDPRIPEVWVAEGADGQQRQQRDEAHGREHRSKVTWRDRPPQI